MATIEEVHRAFGDAAEVGQLIESHLGTMMLAQQVHAENLIDVKYPERAKELVDEINRHTLGQLLRKFHKAGPTLDALKERLEKALDERNRLTHHFFRHHNLRRNSEVGRDIMVADLVAIHELLIEAYKAVMILDGIDLDAMMSGRAEHPFVHDAQMNPTKRLPI